MAGAALTSGGASASTAYPPLARAALSDDVVGLLSASFRYAAPGGGDWAAAADVVQVARGDPKLQEHMAAQPALAQVLQDVERHPGGGITWQEFQEYFVTACHSPAGSQRSGFAAQHGDALTGLQAQAHESSPRQRSPVRAGQSSIQEAHASAGILALRRWLEARCGSLPHVAEKIRSLDTAPLDTTVTRAAVEQFLREVECEAVEDGTLLCVFDCLDPHALGVLDLVDLLGPFEPAVDPSNFDRIGSAAGMNFGQSGAKKHTGSMDFSASGSGTAGFDAVGKWDAAPGIARDVMTSGAVKDDRIGRFSASGLSPPPGAAKDGPYVGHSIDAHITRDDVTGRFGASELSSAASPMKDAGPPVAAHIDIGERDDIMAIARMEAETKESAAQTMSTEHWMTLRVIFYSLLRDACEEVAIQPLLGKIRDDYRIASASILDRLVEMAPGDRHTTLAQALEHVEAQLLPTISWERFRSLILEAPRHRRLTLAELMAKDSSVPDLPPDPHLGSRAGQANEARWDPNEQPELANHWMETCLGVDRTMLSKVFGIFVHCQRGGPAASPVRKGDFVRVLQKNPSLMASFASTPLCSGALSEAAFTPQIWGDVLVHLNCFESDVLTWADVLEVIRWRCDLCFDRVPSTAVGPGGYRCERALAGPAYANGKSKQRLTQLVTGSEARESSEPQRAAMPGVDTQTALASAQLPRPGEYRTAASVQKEDYARVPVDSGHHRFLNEVGAEPASPAAAIGGMFDKALRPESARHAHPFVDYDSDGEGPQQAESEDVDHAAVARLLVEAQRRSGGTDAISQIRRGPVSAAMPEPSALGSAWPDRPSQPQTALRIRLDADHLSLPVEHLEMALAEILQLSPSTVRLKHLRPV